MCLRKLRSSADQQAKGASLSTPGVTGDAAIGMAAARVVSSRILAVARAPGHSLLPLAREDVRSVPPPGGRLAHLVGCGGGGDARRRG